MTASRGVLLVHCFDAYAGAQRVGRAMVTQLREQGVDVAVRLGFGNRGFLSDLPDVIPDWRSNHIPTRKLLYPVWALLMMVPTAWAAARGRIVWANAVYAALPALLAILLFPGRTVIHLHEAVFPRPFHWLLHLAERRGATIVCVSADQARRVGIEAQIVPNAVDAPAIDGPSRRNRILFVGTTQSAKGLALFVATCERIDDPDLHKAAYLSDEDRHDAALVERAQAAGIAIVFGERSPGIIYADGYLVLLCTDPMLGETFSLVAAEAVMHLVPVAGAGVAVLPEVVGAALAFNDPSRDPEQMAAAITALRRAPDRHAELRAACAARRPHLSSTAFTGRVIDLLQQMGSR